MIRHAMLPPPVRPGDRVGVAALSGPIDPERLDAGIEALRGLGFEPVPASNLDRRHELFAGDDEERLDAFHALAADESIAAIVFARGGWGVNRLLDRLDWTLIGRRPRAYVGYSDLTPFLLQVVERLGWISFHGPMVAADLYRGLDRDEETSFLGALAGRFPANVPVDRVPDGEIVEGPLLGGCLSLLTSLVGTPYFPDLDQALLLIEDLNEPPYRVDRMLTHLRLSGTLTRIRGLIAGHLRGAHEPPKRAEITPESVVAAQARQGSFSFASGLPAGHDRPNWTLPLGAWARLDTATGTLSVGLPEPSRQPE